MPPLPKLRVAALADLARQLRFAPRDTVRKQVERAEALAAEIDPDINYPEDWIVFRITGYRADIKDPATVVGAALAADLSALIERLSGSAAFRWSELPDGRFLDAAALATRWNVSRRTLDRFRRRGTGLVARRVMGPRARPILAFPLEAVERFERLHPGDVRNASGFSRIAPDLESRILRRAAVYRRRAGLSLNQAAARLARRFGRAHETMRQLLRRHEADAPIFAEPPALTARGRRAVYRAYRLAIEPGEIAAHFGRSRASIHRVINDERAAHLRPFARPGPVPRESGALAPSPVLTGLGEPGPADVLALVETARSLGAPLGVPERAQAAALRFLVRRAGVAIARLPAHGTPALLLDEIETDLRWAARLKAELVRAHLPLIIRTLETVLARRPEEMRGALLAPLLADCLAAVGDAVDAFDPRGAGRLAAPAGLAVTRIASRFARAHAAELKTGPGGRATPRLRAGTPIPDFTRAVAPWQTFLEPDARIRAALPSLDAADRDFLVARFGWSAPPRTIERLAAELGLTPIKAAIRERTAIRAALGR